MATENKGVTVYLPPEVEEYLTKYCEEYGITRKTKEGAMVPSLGTGVVTYLKEKIFGDDPTARGNAPSKALSSGLSEDEVRAIADSAIEQALVPIRDRLSLMESAGNPITQQSPPAPAPTAEASTPGEPLPGQSSPKAEYGELGPEARSVVNRLLKNEKLRAEVEKLAAVDADELKNPEFVKRLFEAGFGKNGNSEVYLPGEASRLRAAIEYLNSHQ